MLVDIGELREGEEIEADVCVVGSGPSGMALAHELLDSEQRVVMVESGGLEPAPETARLDRGESVGAPGVGMTEGRARALGGASTLWAGQCLPLDPEDFAVRPWVADSGWPISHADLQPFVARAERFFEVDGEPYDERVWAPFDLEPLPLDRSKLTHLATVYTPQPDLGTRFRGALERSRSVRVLLHATAIRLEAGEGGRTVTALRVKGADGREARIRARVFSLCAGAIENARLLLLSDLGNDRDLVGRYFQDHPNVHAGNVETASPGMLLDRYSLLYRKPLRYWAKMGAAPQLQEERRILNGIANLKFDFGADSGLEAAKRLHRAARRRERPADAGRDLVRVGRDLPDLARAYRRFRQGLSPASTPGRIALQLHVEQAPDRESRVRLGTELDPLGQPVAEVDWRVGDQDVETARVVAEAVGEEFARLGVGQVRLTEWRDDADAARGFSGAYHYMGTTRMSDDPSRGVVDRDCAVHGIAGLYCCGGSVFPAGGVANPTLAIAALAIRLADHLRNQTSPR